MSLRSTSLEGLRRRYMNTMLDFNYAKKYRQMLLGAETEQEMTEIMTKARKDWESRGM